MQKTNQNSVYIAQKIKFFIQFFDSKHDQIHKKLQIRSHLLKMILDVKG